MGKIVSELVGICDQLKTDGVINDYSYQEAGRANVELSKYEDPFIIIYCLTDREIDRRNGLLRENASVSILFAKREKDIGFNGGEAEYLTDQVMEIAESFVSLLCQSTEVAITDEQLRLRSVYDQYDTNIVGVVLQANIKELKGHCLTTYEHNQEDQDQ